MSNNIDNVKQWAAELQGFENAYSHRGNDSFSVAGETVKVLPSGIYFFSTDYNGNLIYNKTPVVTDKLISLQNKKIEDLLKTISDFWNSKDTYNLFSQLHKRGILLYGDPGTGKTSTLEILFSNVIENNGLVFLIDDPELSIKAVQRLRKLEPYRNLILVYEDIDSLFDKYGESELLSMLDGQYQFENILHLATTNYINKIPARLKNRPGRFDEVIKIDPPTTDERKLYIEYLMQPVQDKSKILQIIKDTKDFSIAHIKELIISVYLLNKDYNETLNRLKEMGNV